MLTNEVSRLEIRGNTCCVLEVGRDARFVFVDDDSKLPEGFDDLDTHRTDRGIHAIAKVLRSPKYSVISALDDAEERVLNAQVRILAEAAGEECALGLAEAMAREVVAVVKVAITGRYVAHGKGELVDLEVIRRRQDHRLLLALEVRVHDWVSHIWRH